VVTLVGICGDPHYTSCTYPGNFFFLEMGSECSCWLGWGMWWGESGLNEFFRGHESRTVLSKHKIH